MTNLFELHEDDGTTSLLDLEAFNDDVKRLTAGLMVIDKKHPASTELMRIHSTTKSSAYVREVSRRAAYVLMDYLFEAAGTFAMPIALSNLNTFLLAYRMVRPTDLGAQAGES